MFTAQCLPYPEFLKRTDTWTHVRAKFSKILAFKFVNAELTKWHFYIFLTQFDTVFSNLICFL